MEVSSNLYSHFRFSFNLHLTLYIFCHYKGMLPSAVSLLLVSMILQKQFVSFFWPVFCSSLLAFPFRFPWDERSLSSKALRLRWSDSLIPVTWILSKTLVISCGTRLQRHLLVYTCGWTGVFLLPVAGRGSALVRRACQIWGQQHDGRLHKQLIGLVGLQTQSFRPIHNHELKQPIWTYTVLHETLLRFLQQSFPDYITSFILVKIKEVYLTWQFIV